MDKELERRVEDLERRLDTLEKVLGITEEDVKQEAVTRYLEQRHNRREQWRKRSAEDHEQ